MTVKTRKVGNSMVVSIPATLGVSVDSEFEIIKDENNRIVLIPVDFNPFASMPDGFLTDINKELLIDDKPRGGENVEY